MQGLPYGTAKARSLSETEKGGSISSLLPEHHFSLRSITESYARVSATLPSTLT